MKSPLWRMCVKWVTFVVIIKRKLILGYSNKKKRKINKLSKKTKTKKTKKNNKNVFMRVNIAFTRLR